MTTLTELLNNPEEHYPGNFDTPERANALLTGLCQDAAIEIERLNKAQKREWVGMTAADVHAAFSVCLDKEDEVGLFAQTIEAKLKEKNNA